MASQRENMRQFSNEQQTYRIYAASFAIPLAVVSIHNAEHSVVVRDFGFCSFLPSFLSSSSFEDTLFIIVRFVHSDATRFSYRAYMRAMCRVTECNQNLR